MSWEFAFLQKDDIVFINTDGSMEKAPRWLVGYLAYGWTFPGEIRESGKSIVFTYRSVVVARLRKDLVKELCGNHAKGE